MARLIPDDVLATLTIWQEARGEPWEGKVGVAEVIRNRMALGYASDGTVAGTVLRPFQFSGWRPTDPNFLPSFLLDDENPVVRDCAAAWQEAAHGSSLAGGAVLYLNVDFLPRIPSWAADPADPRHVDAKKVTAILGHHTFLKA